MGQASDMYVVYSTSAKNDYEDCKKNNPDNTSVVDCDKAYKKARADADEKGTYLGTMKADGGSRGLSLIGIAVCIPPLLYYLIIGLSKVCMWIIAGFRA